MKFFVYENWLHKKAVIHISECGYCKNGKGIHSRKSNKNGKWLGPFKDLIMAEKAAKKTKEKNLLGCYACLPGFIYKK
ncbi:MAG TPA: hypothetical protein VLH94_02060 [Spirochaetia bacterium]|nr:hypothetical protein [Spirochaetia bacterium]